MFLIVTQANIVVSRGKRRIGYELEMKLKFLGQEKHEGLECAIQINELCDDGSEPETKLYVTKEQNKDQGIRFRQELSQ